MADSIKNAVPIYKIVHSLLHFEGSAPQGGATAEGVVQCCQRVRPYRQAMPERDNKTTLYYGGVYELFAGGDDPIAAMELWIRGTLMGSSALASYVGTRIEPGPIPAGTLLPAIAIVHLATSDVKGSGGVIMTTSATYRVCVVI